jgi:hypothetical protein
LCRREGIVQNLYYRWSKEFLEAGNYRAPVAPALDEHGEDLALVIDGSPQVHPFAGDPDDHLVEMPAVARAWTALS